MKYSTALSVAAKAATYLQDDEGSMSEEEAAVHVSALTHAMKAISKHNSLEDLDATAKAEKASAGLSIAGINVRFFCQVWDDVNGEAYVAEIDESTFVNLGGCVTYHRTTVKDHGCRQICLTTDFTLDG
jgi:hypothetical protein